MSTLRLIVELNDFLTVLKKIRFTKKLGARNIRAETVDFSYQNEELHIMIGGVTHTMPAKGRWKGVVCMPLPYIKGFKQEPPSQTPLVIEYNQSANKLILGSTSVPAQWDNDGVNRAH
jgi:hypothetical protein